MMMKILDVPTKSTSEVKRSPLEIFQLAQQEGSGVYVFNEEKVAGVMISQEQYESLNKEIEYLHDQLAYLLAEKRILDQGINNQD
ncbi:hypothetical protein [Planococcus sp. ISL-109]|uniref:hypothetical protein n=1 Tax=Planococcus sp. ISL-109 TaxID=2819166 RepID=UPI001BE6F324|nr:hypothetical protein [Planococcus sp. ISL-109]MBT2583962.1 hypothetical protein [Planococcus sp. ISL-109]